MEFLIKDDDSTRYVKIVVCSSWRTRQHSHHTNIHVFVQRADMFDAERDDVDDGERNKSMLVNVMPKDVAQAPKLF